MLLLFARLFTPVAPTGEVLRLRPVIVYLQDMPLRLAVADNPLTIRTTP